MADRRPHPKAPPVIRRDGVLRAPPAPRRRPRPSHRHPPPESPPPLLDRNGPARKWPGPCRRRLEAFVGGRLWPGRIALGHLATGLLDLTLRLLTLPSPSIFLSPLSLP